MSDDSLEESNYLTNYEKSLMDKINSNIHNLQIHLNETQNNLKGTNPQTIHGHTLEEISHPSGKFFNINNFRNVKSIKNTDKWK